MAEEIKNRYRIDALYAGLVLMEKLSESADPMNITEAAEAAGISKDVAFRTLKTLEERNFIISGDGGYLPGPSSALIWKRYRMQQLKRIEEAKKAYKDTAIAGGEE